MLPLFTGINAEEIVSGYVLTHIALNTPNADHDITVANVRLIGKGGTRWYAGRADRTKIYTIGDFTGIAIFPIHRTSHAKFTAIVLLFVCSTSIRIESLWSEKGGSWNYRGKHNHNISTNRSMVMTVALYQSLTGGAANALYRE